MSLKRKKPEKPDTQEMLRRLVPKKVREEMSKKVLRRKPDDGRRSA